MNSLLTEILQWMQQNNYRRASFDRLCGIIPSAATYDQLEQLIEDHSQIFRAATLKGGLPGLAVLDEVNIPNVLAGLNVPSPQELSVNYRTGEVTLSDTPPGVYGNTVGYNNTLPGTPSVDAPSVTPSAVETEIHNEKYLTEGQLTLCILTLKNNFSVVGKSACVYPERYDPVLGFKLAREDAVKQIWPLLGFRLADQRTNVT